MATKRNKKKKMLFTEYAIPFILDALDKDMDKDGFVINRKDKQFTLDADGKPFKWNKLIGVIEKKFITKISQLPNVYNFKP